jgi:hypothetical protein
MAVLNDTIRAQCWRGLMRYWSAQVEPVAGITKPDLQAAVNAADDWANTNATSFNNALPHGIQEQCDGGAKGAAVGGGCAGALQCDCAAAVAWGD